MPGTEPVGPQRSGTGVREFRIGPHHESDPILRRLNVGNGPEHTQPEPLTRQRYH